jgi:hypothetical protein
MASEVTTSIVKLRESSSGFHLPSQWSWELNHNVRVSKMRRFRMVDMWQGKNNNDFRTLMMSLMSDHTWYAKSKIRCQHHPILPCTTLDLHLTYHPSLYLKDRYGEPERGEWMGADKNSSQRRWWIQQEEHGFQHTSSTDYPSWPSPRSHWSATGPRNQQTTFRAKTYQHIQRKLTWLAACAAPVRPMACAGQTGDTGQTGGQSQSDRWL